MQLTLTGDSRLKSTLFSKTTVNPERVAIYLYSQLKVKTNLDSFLEMYNGMVVMTPR